MDPPWLAAYMHAVIVPEGRMKRRLAAWRLYGASGYPCGKKRRACRLWIEAETWTTVN